MTWSNGNRGLKKRDLCPMGSGASPTRGLAVACGRDCFKADFALSERRPPIGRCFPLFVGASCVT